MIDDNRASYVRPDGLVRVTGFWGYRGGCLSLGEITVIAPAGVLRFSSTTPMTSDDLAAYATDDYLARHAGRFRAYRRPRIASPSHRRAMAEARVTR